jgi:Rrf2 family protein
MSEAVLRVSRRLRFAIGAVVDIAHHGGLRPVQSRDIAHRQGIPHRYLELVMQRLVHAGILKGVRGPRGGYLLARERRRITVGEIARTVRELESTAHAEEPPTPSELEAKVLLPFWDDLQREVLARLESVTVEELCRRAQAAGVPSGGAERLDFTI